MRILMVLEGEFPSDIRVEKEIRTLTMEGHNVCIACFTKNKKQLDDSFEGAKIMRKPISGFLHKTSVGALKFPFYFNFWKKYLNQILKKEPFDAIHIHDLPLAKVGLEMKQKYGLKLILDLHENYPAHLKIAKHTNTPLGKFLSSNKQWEHYEKRMVSHADAIIAVVDEMKQRLIDIGAPKEKIFVLENFIDLNNSQIDLNNSRNYKNKNKKQIILYSGGITIHRGLQIAIKGLNRALQKNKAIEMWVVGNGSYLSTIKKIVVQLNLQNHVNFFGKLPYNELLKKMDDVDLGVIPHMKTVQSDNSSPNKLFEYMSKGLPILASNCKSVKRIVSEAECGEIFRHNSPDDFAESLINLISNRERMQELSKNAQKAIKEKYNWEKTKINLINLYNSVSS